MKRTLLALIVPAMFLGYIMAYSLAPSVMIGPYSLKKDTLLVSAEQPIAWGETYRWLLLLRDSCNGKLILMVKYQGTWGDSIRLDSTTSNNKGYSKLYATFTADSLMSAALPPITADTTGRYLLKQDYQNGMYKLVWRERGSAFNHSGTLLLQRTN